MRQLRYWYWKSFLFFNFPPLFISFTTASGTTSSPRMFFPSFLIISPKRATSLKIALLPFCHKGKPLLSTSINASLCCPNLDQISFEKYSVDVRPFFFLKISSRSHPTRSVFGLRYSNFFPCFEFLFFLNDSKVSCAPWGPTNLEYFPPVRNCLKIQHSQGKMRLLSWVVVINILPMFRRKIRIIFHQIIISCSSITSFWHL